MMLSKKRNTRALIRLRGCAGWSAPLLFATTRRQVFSRRGPFIVEQFTYISFTCARQIKITRPLDLHYIAQPLYLHYNHYASLARLLGLYYNQCVSIRLFVLGQQVKMLITGCAHYCLLIFCRISIELIQTIQFEENWQAHCQILFPC